METFSTITAGVEVGYDYEGSPNRGEVTLWFGTTPAFSFTVDPFVAAVMVSDANYRDRFVAERFGKLFDMLGEWEAGAEARTLAEGGI